ncbi:hypothetical protein VOLCADRAFT_94524 [Volvox carteri f. nagariensis]|uniref:Uncharacterized protein n=1 Tax=Volvox carteri f. nagariensis TaxID=3068 RepID=D8U507_VOLCA|nr:uncharacterized protein VOLCADRAFT_94524 [Volvox carteri f. nagariensis]EFJ45134.1 hypothetical protein VOLCADRAFT_94524 [Volvox carteri f. nagariensis]|eukprot:XP_002953810.1 hypothetical protein VOLCADRAFT_94524 [Volvox carteri f. nagariensis]
MDGASTTVPPSSVSGGVAQLDRLTLTQLARTSDVLADEPLQALTRLAATNQSCQVLEAISKTALVLRDAPTAAPCGTTSLGLEALPQCSSAYAPAATIPETCVTLFHVHNILLQAAYASQQDFDVWTELVQAGVELYLRKAPRHIVAFSNANLEPILDALAHQDLWRFQYLLWQRLLAHIPTWDSMQDFCSVIHGCELAAQEATTAATAAAAAAAAGAGLGGGSVGVAGDVPADGVLADMPGSWSADMHGSHGGFVPDIGGFGLPWASTAGQIDVLPSIGRKVEAPNLQTATAAATSQIAAATAAAAASALYERQAELAEYSILMRECIREALEGAATRGLASSPQPHAAAQQLLEAVTLFEARQRSATTLTALRCAFIPTPDWLSRVAAAGVQGSGWLSAAQVVKLLQDLDALAPQPVESQGQPSRWLNATGQAAAERAVLRHISSRAWSPQQAISVIKVLVGKCRGPPGDQLCGVTEGLLLTCSEAWQDAGLMCAVLQEAVEFASPPDGSAAEGSSSATALTVAHLSLARAALNRASYLVESTAPRTNDGGDTAAAPETDTSASGSGRVMTGPRIWRSREFLYERYPRLLQAARRFGYPLQAFRLQEYVDELYNHLAASPGHELVAVGPEGLALALQAVVSSPCCRDPQWAAAFERACLMLISVQFSVGYTHPKRWLGLLEATVNTLPFPMPALAAGIKALLVRLCDTRRHAKYFWQVLPLIGALERRAAAVAWGQHSHDLHGMGHHQSASDQSAASMWTPVSSMGASGKPSSPASNLAGRLRINGVSVGKTVLGGGPHRRGPPGTMAHRGSANALPSGRSSVSSSGSGAASSSQQNAATAGAGNGGNLRPVLPPPDISKHHISEEEYNRWCEDLGQRLALSMACLSDQDRVAQLSVFGIGATGP